MPLGAGVQRSIRYKAYATGAITDDTQPVSTVDPAVTGGQILRRVSSTLTLTKDNYKPNEINTSRQNKDIRHGTKRVTGAISGELSLGTYFDFMEASCRATKASVVTLGPSALTSIAADNSTSKFICGGGDAVSSGLRTGDIIRFTNLADTNNNATNFIITGFSGSNRNIIVTPAPETMSADTSFTLATAGKTVFVPSSSFVERKFAIEHYGADVDLSELYTECRSGGFNLKLPATGNATIDLPFAGRDMEEYASGSAPFFTAPTAETSTGILQSVNGLLQIAGSTVAVVTSVEVNMNLNPSSDAVVGQNIVPEIWLGKADVTGTMTAFLKDHTLLNLFVNETPFTTLLYLKTTSAVNSPAMTIYMPVCKFTGGSIATSGENGQVITFPFQAVQADGTVAGDESTTIRIMDTAAV